MRGSSSTMRTSRPLDIRATVVRQSANCLRQGRPLHVPHGVPSRRSILENATSRWSTGRGQASLARVRLMLRE